MIQNFNRFFAHLLKQLFHNFTIKMRNFTIICISIIFSFSIESNAQRIGIGLAYGTKIASSGISINGEYFVSNALAISPGFIFFLEEQWEVNGNANFVFSSNYHLMPYIISGINVTNNSDNTKLGLNFGVGANYRLRSKSRFFTEAKFVTGSFYQLVVSAGIKLPI